MSVSLIFEMSYIENKYVSLVKLFYFCKLIVLIHSDKFSIEKAIGNSFILPYHVSHVRSSTLYITKACNMYYAFIQEKKVFYDNRLKIIKIYHYQQKTESIFDADLFKMFIMYFNELFFEPGRFIFFISSNQ